MSRPTITRRLRDSARKKSATFTECAAEFYQKIIASDLPTAAGSLAYTTILSIIPLIAMSFALFKAFGGLDKMYESIKPIIFDNLAEGTDEKVIGTIEGFVRNAHTSAFGIAGLIGLIITSFAMLSKVEKSINTVWGTKIERSLFSRWASYWFFVTLGPLALGGLVSVASSGNLPIAALIPGTGVRVLFSIGFFYAIYRWVPAARVQAKPALIAACYATLCWQAARFGYTIYSARAMNASKIYGSLGAVPIILVWIYINWLVVLSGAALSVVLQRRVLAK